MAADSRTPGGGSALLRAAGIVFLALGVLGLVLLFFPDLANDLDRRSAGGSAISPESVSVTEAKRTTEEATEAERGSESDSTAGGADNDASNGRRKGPRNGDDTRTRQTTRSDTNQSSTITETTTRTETVSPTDAGQGVLARALSVPAVMVLLRCAAIALLAGLAALPLLVAARRSGLRASSPAGEVKEPTSASTPSPPGPTTPPPAPARRPPPVPASDGASASASPAPNGSNSHGGKPVTAPVAKVASAPAEQPTRVQAGRAEAPLPVKPVVTRADAEEAKAKIIAGIPLLSEIFDARGEPAIVNTLPDMRVRVQLTDSVSKEQPLPVSVLAEDATLALATFRTEVEQRLRRLARDAVAQSAESTDSILRGLIDEGLFDPQAAEGFRNLLQMSERAVHGARVDPAMGAWVREEGVSLLLSLDLMLPS